MSDNDVPAIPTVVPGTGPSMLERIEALESGTVATGESVGAADALQARVTDLEEKLADALTLINLGTDRLLELEAVSPAIEIEEVDV
ncbi:MAG: hypothetical protein GY903_01155 [Fuerstiella sp.]|nr:hypothetical protein [Fuerstiella sp.]MCP4853086.1 hypothetical protein [Fuerstiella sp.]